MRRVGDVIPTDIGYIFISSAQNFLSVFKTSFVRIIIKNNIHTYARAYRVNSFPPDDPYTTNRTCATFSPSGLRKNAPSGSSHIFVHCHSCAPSRFGKTNYSKRGVFKRFFSKHHLSVTEPRVPLKKYLRLRLENI